MKKNARNEKRQSAGKLRKDASIGGKIPGRNVSEQEEIEQTRIENRREADLDDKTPAGDAGVEDNEDLRKKDSGDEPVY